MDLNVTTLLTCADPQSASWRLPPYSAYIPDLEARACVAGGSTRTSVRAYRQPLAFRQMARGNHHEVATLERGHLAKVKALGQGDDAGVDRLQAKGRVRRQQLGHAAVVVGRHLDDAELIRADRGAEPGGQTR